jgi:RNA polymerase-binding transcription factor DksA
VTAPDAERVLRTVEADLDAVDAALSRLDDGCYGTCSRCGQDIPAPVLAADPLADRCLATCDG